MVVLGYLPCSGQTDTQQRIDSLLQLLNASTTVDTTRILNLLRVSAAHDAIAPLEELKYASKAYTLSLDMQYERGIIESINLIGAGFLEMEQYDTALSCFISVLKMFERNADTMGISKVYNNIGNVYYAQNYQEQALAYFYKSLQLHHANDWNHNTAALYNNIGAAYQEQDKFDSARKYFELALKYKRKQQGTITYAITQGNMGSMYVMSNQPNAGRPFLDSARAVFKREASFSTLSLVYRLVADGWRKLGRQDSSLAYLDSAETCAHRANGKKLLSNIYKSYAATYEAMGQCSQAHGYLKQANHLTDSLQAAQSIAKLLNMKHLYEMQQQESLQQIQAQKIELLRQEKQQAALQRNMIVLGAVLLALALAIYLRMLAIKQQKNRQLMAAQEEVNTTKMGAMQQEIAYKNQALASSALQIIQKNDVLKRVQASIGGLPVLANGAQREKVDRLTQEINNSFNLDKDWDDFKLIFDQVHQDFFSRLQAQYPQVSPADMRLCALLKLNFSSKQMADILGISVESVKTARSRLRKKLNLNRETNLVDFMIQF